MSAPETAARPIPRLPQLSTRDLNGVRRTLPNGRLAVLVVGYRRWHQQEVDSWVPALAALERTHDEVTYYELPVVGRMNPAARRTLDTFMRLGVRDPDVRARTLTFYVDSSGFREPLGIIDEDHVTVVLVDVDGLVLWQASGPHSPGAEHGLRAAVTAATRRRVH